MADAMRRKIVALSALTPLIGAATAVWAAEGRAKTFPVPLSGREKIRQRYLPSVPLFTHEGKKVVFYDDLVKGKIVTINFFYSHCEEICPLVTANLVKVQKLLGDRVGRDIFM